MRLTQLRMFPFHIFLLPTFFIWHVLNEYFGLITLRYTGKFILYYFSLSLFLFFIGKLLFRNSIKAGCWTTLLLIIFFFWGAGHDHLKEWHLPDLVTSYSFLLPGVFVYIVAATLSLKRKYKPFTKLNRFFTLLFSILLLWELGISVYKLANGQIQKNNLFYNNKSSPVNLDTAGIQKPDIFFIVFDEYASSTALMKYLDYDNSPLDSILAAHQFFVIKNSKSNYNSTPHSLASTLNFDYFNLGLEDQNTIPKALLQGQYSLKKSRLPKLLFEQGYIIKNYGYCSLENAAAPVEPIFYWRTNDYFYNETMMGRIELEIWWHVSIRFPFLRIDREKPKDIKQIHTNTYNYAGLLDELNTQGPTPKFVFGHLMLPHRPYLVNKWGARRRTYYISDDLPYVRDSLYIDQLKFANRLIDSLSGAADQPFKRPRVVIIAGDHGRRSPSFKITMPSREQQFMNLNTYYFSDQDYSLLYDSISSVNTFRVVLNKYFKTQLPLLADSTIAMR